MYFLYVSVNITSSGSAGLLKLFDTTATITPGTTVPSHVLPFTASTSAAANSTTYIFPEGLIFSNGVGVCVALDAAAGYGTLAGSANLGATVTSCVISYK